MSKWYNDILVSKGDARISILGDALVYFEEELEDARKEIKIKGNIEKLCSQLPAHVEYRYSQLQEIEAILRLYELEHRRIRQNKFKAYLENYQRTLSPTVADKYADNDTDVIQLLEIINHISLLRNKFLGITKSLENKAFQINNIVKLRAAGLEDAELDGQMYN